MVEFARGLTHRDLCALAELEQRVVAADGGRLKLEWGVLRARAGPDVNDFLCWERNRLVGFVGLYSFGSAAVEIAGMVDPSERRLAPRGYCSTRPRRSAASAGTGRR